MKIPRLPIGAEARVEMLPLIDVVFLVLIAFIYASAFLAPKTGLPVDLPQASEGKPQDAAVVTVTIERDGSLFLDKRAISIDDLGRALVQAKHNNDKTRLYVKADRAARLASLVQVMDIARRAELAGLTIATRRSDKNTQQAAPGS